MIVCPVCGHSNDEFSITCSSCSSYIQDRVPNLDFFAVVWLMVESPREAFRKIIIAEHKNFVLFLSLFLGTSGVFAMMRDMQSGNSFDNLFPLLLLGIASGLIVSLPLFAAYCGTIHGLSKVLKGKGSFLESYGITGWSLVPVMFSTVFVLPLELGTLGLLMFSSNPSAMEVKPVVTMVLLGLDGAFVLWSVTLSAIGLSMVHRFRFVTAFLITLVSAAAVSVLSLYIYSSFTI
jgi:hypothetical protein